MQSNPRRDRTNVGEANLRIVEDRKWFKRARFVRSGGRKPPESMEGVMSIRKSPAYACFRASARRMPPTKKHRPALWECMLGTVYANNGKETQYFDYDYEAAVAFIGAHQDIRVSRTRYAIGLGEHFISARKLVWFVVDAAPVC